MRKSSRQKKRDRLNLMLAFIILVGVVAVIGATYAFISSAEPERDKLTLCSKDGASAHTVLLIDTTDPFNFMQKQAYKVIMEKMVSEEINKNELVSVFLLGENYTDSTEPLIEVCNPGDGSDQSAMTSNLKRLKEQFDRNYHKPLMEVVEALPSATESKFSPVIEQIQLVSLNGFKDKNIKGPKRLIIVSDMLHNTKEFSMYRSNYTYEEFTNTVYAKKLSLDLRGVEVELHYLMNSPKLQTRKHLKFWEDFFVGANSKIVSVRPLEG